MVICLERGADLHMAQLMPLPLTISCSSKSQIGFTGLVPAHLGSPGQRSVKCVCVCVCACVRACVCFKLVCIFTIISNLQLFSCLCTFCCYCILMQDKFLNYYFGMSEQISNLAF